MILFIVLCFFSSAFAFLHVMTKSTRKLKIKEIYIDISLGRVITFFLMVLPPIFVAGFRYGISVDYFNVYQNGFLKIMKGEVVEGFESGFVLLVVFFSKIYASPEFLFFSFSAITLLIYFYSFNESKNYVLSVILLFGTGVFFDSFNGIRQYIVVAIFMHCLHYIKTQNMKLYMITMASCAFIHSSALFTLPLYFFCFIKIDVKKIMIVLIAIVLTKEYLYDLVLFLMQLIPKYKLYILRDTIQSQISFSKSGFVFSLIALVPCLIVNHKMKKNNEGRFLFNIVLIGLILSECSSFIPLMERMLYYTKSYVIFSIPYACSLIKNRHKKNIVMCTTVSLIIAMNFIGMLYFNWYAVLPYSTIFTR